jgi:exopolyphosphatase/guanosine-5'-triphosphate,3'-diphosphate pyrophosphatase
MASGPRLSEATDAPEIAGGHRAVGGSDAAGDASWLSAASGEIGRKLARRVHKVGEGKAASVFKIHQLRVLCRRVQAALDLATPAMPARVSRALDRVRRAAGRVRDADVLAELVAKEPDVDATSAGIAGLRRWAATRAARSRVALARVARAECKRIDELSKKLAGVRAQGERAPVSAGDGHAWREPLGRLVRAAELVGRSDLRDVDQLHELRIALKRVRYSVELCETALGGAGMKVASGLAGVQQTLGHLNDCAMIAARAEKLLVKASKNARTGAQRSTAKRAKIAGLRAILKAKQRAITQDAKIARERWASDGRSALSDLRDLIAPPIEVSNTQDATMGGPTIRFVDPNAAERQKTGDGQRIGAIDIGTNSMRLIIAEAHPDGSYRVLDDEKELTRLGAGLDASGKLSASAIEHGVGTLARMVRIASGFGVRMLRAVATSAVREATNGAEFCALAEKRTGLAVEIISAEEEALLAYRSVAGAFDVSGMTVSVVDIGGGSTEVVTASAGLIERVELLPIGAVKLTERFGGAKAAAGRRYPELRKFLDRFVRDRVSVGQIQPQLIIGTGGTLTTLAQLSMARAGATRSAAPAPTGAVRGYEVKRSELKGILDDLRSMSLERRTRVAGLSADRADIIVPALSVLHTLCKRTGVKRVRVHDGGIRDGLLLTMVAEVFPQDELARAQRVLSQAGDVMASVRRFAKSCRYDAPHSEHVAKLALRIFDQLRQDERRNGALNDDARRLLEAASLLLDVGYIVNYDRHHVHSYNLIVHSDLAGWDRRQVRLIAAIARYHRGGEPQDRHRQLKGLSESDRIIVRKLAAIVRIAVGLDRTHTQSVADVRLAPAGDVLRVIVDSAADPAVDVWGAQRKSAMFAGVFGIEPRFAWAGEPGAGRDRSVSRSRVTVTPPAVERARASG